MSVDLLQLTAPEKKPQRASAKRTAGALAALFAAASLSVLAASPAFASMSTSAGSGSGWLRFGHFVASAPPVDVTVDGTTIGTDIAFRDVTGYVPVHSGDNTVAIYSASAGTRSSSIATISADVPSGGAVTVAAFASTGATTSGTGSVAGGIAIQVFTDDLSSPPAGDAKVRVIHTIPGAPVVDTDLVAMSAGSSTPTVELSPVGYKQASAYEPVAAGTYEIVVKTTSGTVVTKGDDWQASSGSVASIVIVEAPSGPSLEILTDAAGTATAPNGSMQTGFGGTAPGRGLWDPAMLAVTAVILALIGLAVFLRRSIRRVPAHTHR
jgi:hypothetical protein